MSEPVNTQVDGQSLKRQERAAAAQVLLSLHEKGQLANPEQWTWDVLDALPTWCLLDEQTRSQLQMMCGALVLAPELRLWIDRELIVAAHTVIGQHHFTAIVAKADQAKLPINAAAGERYKSVSGKTALRDAVQSAFLQAGASVLKASLTNDILIERFSAMLGDTAGDVRHKLAGNILQQAHEMLSTSEAADNPVNKDVNDAVEVAKGDITGEVAGVATGKTTGKTTGKVVKADAHRRTTVKADEVHA